MVRFRALATPERRSFLFSFLVKIWGTAAQGDPALQALAPTCFLFVSLLACLAPARTGAPLTRIGSLLPTTISRDQARLASAVRR
jgi:hypothetical protein